MAAVVNTAAGPSTYHRRHQLIRPVSSPLSDGKETNGGETRADCVQDYSPCTCSVNVYNEIYVTCSGVSVETVRDVFKRVNDLEIYSLVFYPLADYTNTVTLLLDFFGNTSVTGNIGIYGNPLGNPGYPNLVVDPFAFSSSQNSLTRFYVKYFDFGMQKDFNFLNGFSKLKILAVSEILNLTAFQYLPPLPSLQWLDVAYCPDLNQIAFPDLSPAKLKYLYLSHSEISDEKADEIVAKLAASTSADSLEWLILSDNSLTRILSQVGSAFPKITDIVLDNNKISHIPSSSLTFAHPLQYLTLYENGIKTIESGAFQGKSTSVHASIFFFMLTTICFYRKFYNDSC